MAKKDTTANEATTKTIYIVAPEHAFTHNGVIFADGDAITEKEFENQTAFEKLIAAGGIIAKQVESEKTEETKKDENADGANADADTDKED